MRVSTSSFTDGFLYQINQLQSQQTTLQGEASTGLSITEPEQDPAVMNQVLNLQSEASAGAQYQNNIAQIQNSATTASDALNSLQSLVEQAGEIATQANGLSSPTQLSSYATQVGQLIQQALQIANTQDANGNYIFGGTETGTAPFSATTSANGDVTSVAYSGNTSVADSEIAPGLTVSAQTPGENNTGSGAEGVFADSRTGADLFSHLISLQQNLQSGNTSAIASTDSPNLTKDENNVVTQISGNAVLQSTLEVAGNVAKQQVTTETAQMSNDTSANLAQTLTQLSQTQTAYQAALESGTMVMSISLVDFLQ
ncbi:MAG TPA: flagellar hook-associated protein FlgL [Verrucomicrobiae bacterium]|jgi:flagellar hook-associated protein 3 FlgL|nr:flagellar hook-associated protein FlgL [Verrucomicrobiae bacterium]